MGSEFSKEISHKISDLNDVTGQSFERTIYWIDKDEDRPRLRNVHNNEERAREFFTTQVNFTNIEIHKCTDIKGKPSPSIHHVFNILSGTNSRFYSVEKTENYLLVQASRTIIELTEFMGKNFQRGMTEYVRSSSIEADFTLSELFNFLWEEIDRGYHISNNNCIDFNMRLQRRIESKNKINNDVNYDNDTLSSEC